MSTVVQRNIAELMAVREAEERRKSLSERVAGSIAAFAGSMWSVGLHVLVYGGWLAVNSRAVPIVEPWDPFPFVMLAMAASVEALFLSTFILINQNRMQRMADRRAELDLQISLLTEHELTRAVTMIDEIACKLGAPRPPREEMDDIRKDVNPRKVAEEIDKAEQKES
jgi:uncharacterized membrane protein